MRRKSIIVFILLVQVFVVECGQSEVVFRTSAGGEVDQGLNRMWDVYGRVVDGAALRRGAE